MEATQPFNKHQLGMLHTLDCSIPEPVKLSINLRPDMGMTTTPTYLIAMRVKTQTATMIAI
jgi:hypothetical protein